MTGRANKALGRYGEDVAARYLTEQGITVLERNWSCHEGELDLIGRDGATLVVCEVKTRRAGSARVPLEAVTAAKYQRLQRLADLWLEQSRVRPDGIRIDLVGVLLPRRGAGVVEHLPGVTP